MVTIIFNLYYILQKETPEKLPTGFMKVSYFRSLDLVYRFSK